MRVVVAAWVGSTNTGDELIFSQLARHLLDRGHEVTALSVDPATTRVEHGVHAVPGDRPAAARAIAGADLMVFGGGGLLQDESSVWNLPFHLSRVAAARLSRTPWVVVGLGAGRLGSASSRLLVRSTFRGAGAVVVRDRDSQALLASLGITSRRGADLVYLAPPVTVPADDRFAVSLRAPQSGRARRAGTTTRLPGNEWLEAMASALDRIGSATGLLPSFVALHRGRDEPVHAAVSARMHGPSERLSPSWQEAGSVVGSCRFAVTMRYHGAVVASLAGRPSVCIGFSPKLAEIASDLVDGALLVDDAPPAFAGLHEAVAALPSECPPEPLAALRQRAELNLAALDEAMARL